MFKLSLDIEVTKCFKDEICRKVRPLLASKELTPGERKVKDECFHVKRNIPTTSPEQVENRDSFK